MTVDRGPLAGPSAGDAVPGEDPGPGAELDGARLEPVGAPEQSSSSSGGGPDPRQVAGGLDGEPLDLTGEHARVVGVGLAHQGAVAGPGGGGLAHEDRAGLVPDERDLRGRAVDPQPGGRGAGGQPVCHRARGGVPGDVGDLDVEVLGPQQPADQRGEPGVVSAEQDPTPGADVPQGGVDLAGGGDLVAVHPRVFGEDGRDRRGTAADDDHVSIMAARLPDGRTWGRMDWCAVSTSTATSARPAGVPRAGPPRSPRTRAPIPLTWRCWMWSPPPTSPAGSMPATGRP